MFRKKNECRCESKLAGALRTVSANHDLTKLTKNEMLLLVAEYIEPSEAEHEQ